MLIKKYKDIIRGIFKQCGVLIDEFKEDINVLLTNIKDVNNNIDIEINKIFSNVLQDVTNIADKRQKVMDRKKYNEENEIKQLKEKIEQRQKERDKRLKLLMESREKEVLKRREYNQQMREMVKENKLVKENNQLNNEDILNLIKDNENNDPYKIFGVYNY